MQLLQPAFTYGQTTASLSADWPKFVHRNRLKIMKYATFKLHSLKDSWHEVIWPSVTISIHTSAALAVALTQRPKIASSPRVFQLTTFCLDAARIEKQKTRPEHRHTDPQGKRQLGVLYSFLTCHQQHIFSAEVEPNLDKSSRTRWDGGSSWARRRGPPTADWFRVPECSATTTGHDQFRPIHLPDPFPLVHV